MDRIIIQGNKPLSGAVKISGAKNAVLPAMAATLLAPGEFTIHKVPDLRDTRTMMKLLNIIGAATTFDNGTLTINSSAANNPEAPYDLVKTKSLSLSPFHVDSQDY